MKTFFGNLNITNVTDNKTFYRTIEPFFIDKVKTCSKNALIQKMELQRKEKEKVIIEEVISNDCDISETLNNFLKI